MTTKIIEKLFSGKNISSDESQELFDEVFTGIISEIMLSAILTAFKIKGETAEEISGAALSMRKFSLKPEISATDLVDTCGTGGDSSHSFNISSAVAIIVSAMGYNVAKHGNRSMTSKSGSADFFEALKIPVNLKSDEAGEYFQKNNFVFMFAPNYHPAMKHAVPVRKELKTRTMFNYLGPLTNPAGTKRQAVGVYHPDVLPLYAAAAKKLEYEHIVLYSGSSGFDEVSPFGETVVYECKKSKLEIYSIFPEKYISHDDALTLAKDKTAEENAEMFLQMLNCKSPDALAKTLALNSGLALKAAGHSDDFDKNYKDALDAICSGQVLQKVKELTE